MTNRLKVGNVYAFTVATEMIEFHSGQDRAVHDLKCVAMGKDIAPLLKVKYAVPLLVSGPDPLNAPIRPVIELFRESSGCRALHCSTSLGVRAC